VLLKDKVAIVTGSALGIGRGIALKFAEEGASVVVTDINDTEGKKTLEGVQKAGREGLYVHCDVTDYQQVQETVSQTLKKFGRIDILVNNAGGVPGIEGSSIDDVSVEQWDKIVNLNLKSTFLGCKAVVPLMRERKYGKIVNLSSMGAVYPPASLPHYHAAKAGVIGLTVNLAFELARYNITVNAILPGPVQTPFWEPVTRGIKNTEAFFAEVARHDVPMQRMGKPEDIAGVALFLASDLSGFMTGESLMVGGGLPLPVLQPK
jgi:NAD(P)-dependent dehydrogenase (short-subunit alcohol dehydrogenase family)